MSHTRMGAEPCWVWAWSDTHKEWKNIERGNGQVFCWSQKRLRNYGARIFLGRGRDSPTLTGFIIWYNPSHSLSLGYKPLTCLLWCFVVLWDIERVRKLRTHRDTARESVRAWQGLGSYAILGLYKSIQSYPQVRYWQVKPYLLDSSYR